MYYELRKRGTTAHAPLQEGCTQGRQLGLGSESPCCAGQAEMIRTKREHDHVCGWRNVKVVPRVDGPGNALAGPSPGSRVRPASAAKVLSADPD